MSEEAAKIDYLIDAIGEDLRISIASLGYPVGMGLGPSPESCRQAAQRLVDRIGKDALSVLASREALLSSAQGETKEGFDGLPELPCGEQPGAALGATAALAGEEST